MPKTNPHQVLWAALLKIYGSQQAAEQAARDNPQILNPSYSFCNTMLASADVLNNMMSKEEARSGHGAPILATDERCGALPRSPWRTTPWHPLHRPVPLHPLQLSSPAALFSCPLQAMEVMTNNPAVLQCGPALDTLGREHVETAPRGHAPVAMLPQDAPLLLPRRPLAAHSPWLWPAGPRKALARARPYTGWAVA